MFFDEKVFISRRSSRYLQPHIHIGNCSHELYYCIGRGVGRIVQGGVQFAKCLLTTPTFKKPHPFICKLRGTAFNINYIINYEGVFYIVARKRVAS